jgi:ferredoxin
MCRSNGPQFFQRHEAGGYTYVHRQPVTEEEIALAEDARISCPTESIGCDG